MTDLPLLIGASLGHFDYNRLIAACQQKNCTKISRSFRHIVQCPSGGSGGRMRRELCRGYNNRGKQRKTRQQTVSGLVNNAIGIRMIFILTSYRGQLKLYNVDRKSLPASLASCQKTCSEISRSRQCIHRNIA